MVAVVVVSACDVSGDEAHVGGGVVRGQDVLQSVHEVLCGDGGHDLAVAVHPVLLTQMERPGQGVDIPVPAGGQAFAHDALVVVLDQRIHAVCAHDHLKVSAGGQVVHEVDPVQDAEGILRRLQYGLLLLGRELAAFAQQMVRYEDLADLRKLGSHAQGHAFDLNKVAGRTIDVRRAHTGEKIVTLDEKEFTLNPNNLVICDAEKPVALAGIMGGANSGMDENTTSLLFECATFARDCVRKTSRALGQNSDSSARYEKGVDRHSPELGLARALHLIQELDCGDITTLEYDLTDGRPMERKHIVTTPAKICGVLGITVPDQTMIDILQRLEFTVDVQADGSWDVSAPLYRDDVESFPDLAEEVIREYGYDHIVPTFLNTASVTNGGLNYDQKQQLKTKRLLAAQGFYEASTLAFYSNAELDMLHIPADDEARKAIRILNPISENLSIMRTLLAPSMLNVIVDNLKKGNTEGRLFEMAPVYLAKELPINEHPHERQTLCIGAFGPEEDFFTVKGALEALAAGFGLSFDYKRETTPRPRS